MELKRAAHGPRGFRASQSPGVAFVAGPHANTSYMPAALG